jgi:chitin disaccharide deacetylase
MPLCRYLLAALLSLSVIVAAQKPAGKSVQEKLGHPASARLLVIHADDFGMCHSVNQATLEALERGWVTSASILVPAPWFPDVVRWSQQHPEADLGIHLALNSEWTGFRWGPLTPTGTVPSLVDEQGYLPYLETTVAEKADPKQVEIELRTQIDKAKRAGIRLTHLDTHMTALTLSPELFQTYKKLGREYGLPVLLERRSGTYLPLNETVGEEALVDQVVSIAPGVAPKDWLQAYKEMLQPLPPGVYQLIVHTAYDDAEMRAASRDHPNWGSVWRQLDFDVVRSQEFRDFLREQKFILVNWKDLSRALPADYTKVATSLANTPR